MADNLLTDIQLFDALECGLKLQYEQSHSSTRSASLSPDSSSDLKSALYRRLLKLYTLTEGIEEKHPDDLSVWLKGTDPGAFFDLPLHAESFRTTLPLLYRNQSGKLILAQFQGRRWSKKEHIFRKTDLLNPKINRYIHRLAFRYTLFCVTYPDIPPPLPILIFPNSAYRKEPDYSFEDFFDNSSTTFSHSSGTSLHTSAKDIFVKIDCLEMVCLSRPNSLEWINGLKNQIRPESFIPGKHCFACRYRKRIPGLSEGCWQHHSDVKELMNPHLQIPDLPGHGNLSLIEEGILFQEQASQDPQDPANLLTLQWRRAKQIEIASKGVLDPHQREVIHPGLKDRLMELRFPLHFLDFEAASFPVSPGFPRKPYTPVLFQYSCHTISTPEDLFNGHLRHHHWIDSELSGDPEVRLMESLLAIENIHKGTIFHYAPFERQHLLKLHSRAQQESAVEWSSLSQPLKEFVHSQPGSSRFVDLADWVARYYFHEKLEGKLGLKDLYFALLAEKFVEAPDDSEIPYHDRVKNGEHAMHIYLGLRTGILDLSTKEYWMNRLLEYCAMDTFIMARALIYWNNKLQ